jgi:hypothetical protein
LKKLILKENTDFYFITNFIKTSDLVWSDFSTYINSSKTFCTFCIWPIKNMLSPYPIGTQIFISSCAWDLFQAVRGRKGTKEHHDGFLSEQSW